MNQKLEYTFAGIRFKTYAAARLGKSVDADALGKLEQPITSVQLHLALGERLAV